MFLFVFCIWNHAFHQPWSVRRDGVGLACWAAGVWVPSECHLGELGTYGRASACHAGRTHPQTDDRSDTHTHTHAINCSSLCSRSIYQYIEPRLHTWLEERAFSFCGPLLWNNLPNELHNIADVSCFKCHLTSFLLSCAFNRQLYYAFEHYFFVVSVLSSSICYVCTPSSIRNILLMVDCLFTTHKEYCKTPNVSMRFISRISQAKQNCEINCRPK